MVWNSGSSAIFLNETNGILTINRAILDGLLVDLDGAVNNKGTIIIGQIGTIGGDGIEVAAGATFNNSTCTATVKIVSDNVINSLGTFNNTGIIFSGATGNSNISTNTGVVQNQSSGTFTITTGPAAIPNFGPIWTGCTSSDWNTASNWHTKVTSATTEVVTIADITAPNFDPVIISAVVGRKISLEPGALLAISNGGSLSLSGSVYYGILNYGSVENDGTLTINDNKGDALYIGKGGSFVNNGTIDIGNTVDIDGAGVFNVGTFVNESGSISINRAGKTSGAALSNAASFTNKASISIGGNPVPGSDGRGLWNSGASANFTNEIGGSISIDRMAARSVTAPTGYYPIRAISMLLISSTAEAVFHRVTHREY